MSASAGPKQFVLPYGAWYADAQRAFSLPDDWNVHLCAPRDAGPLEDKEIESALGAPVDNKSLSELALGKRSAVIAVDDITRPTPAARILPIVLGQLEQAGIQREQTTILVGTGAHRPMDPLEIQKKLSTDVASAYRVVVHDFMGNDVRKVGWIAGGPVYLNRHLLDADVKICLGSVIPHSETGFGGGAKLVVPGLAGHFTISHFHGALPARRTGQFDAPGNSHDRRWWAEVVARHVGIDMVICAVVNSRRQLAGLIAGDLVGAHRQAARLAARVGATEVPESLFADLDILVLNAYPLDTDPIQMGKCLALAAKLSARCTVIINAASDGLYYHGVGLGGGVDFKRLATNLPRWLASPRRVILWFRSLAPTVARPALAARFSYFTWNVQSYSGFLASEQRRRSDLAGPMVDAGDARLLVYSPGFPRQAFARRYPRGVLYQDWDQLCQALSSRFKAPNVAVFPCAPLQWIATRGRDSTRNRLRGNETG